MGPDQALAFASSPEGIAAARVFLSAYRHLDAMIAAKLARLDMLREKARRIRQALTGDPMEDAVREGKELEEEILRDYRALLDRQKRIGEAVARVPDAVQRAVLEMRYLQSLPYFRIAMELNYDERQIYRIHEKALRHIALQLTREETK